MNETLCLVIYFGAVTFGLAGGVWVGYLIREAKHWGDVAKQYEAMRRGSPVR